MMSPEQCRAARAWLGWSQEDLATNASVAVSTVRDFEADRRWEPTGHNYEAMQRALQDSGILFLSGTGKLAGIEFDPRIKESDLYQPILATLAAAPAGFMKTSDLIKQLEEEFEPSGDDAKILAGRSDTRFSQIVRNVISHRGTSINLIGRGSVEYDKPRRGLRITQQGRAELGGKRI